MKNPRRWIRLLSGAGLGLWACNQGAAVNTSYIPVASALTVRPRDFLGDVLCSTEPGAMKLYRATLLDVTDDPDSPEALPSSGLVSCDRDILFESVTVGRRYIASIEAYDQSDLRLEGTRVVDAGGDRVNSTWSTTCIGDEDSGEGGSGGEEASYGVWVYRDTRLPVRGCAALERQTPVGPTGAIFRAEEIFPELTCGSSESSLQRFSVTLAEGEASEENGAGGFGGGEADSTPPPGGAGGASAPSDDSVPCSEALRVSLLPNQRYTFEVLGYAGGAEPSWTTRCSLTAELGVERRPTCVPAESLR